MNKFDKSDYIQAMKLGSGFAAVHCTWVTEGHFWDIQQTGVGRYATKAEAIKEAKEWAEAEEIRYKE